MSTTPRDEDLDTVSSVSRQHYIDTGRYLTVDEVNATPRDDIALVLDRTPIKCDSCGDRGYLVEQGYGYADIPEGWAPVQACGQCGMAYAQDIDDEHAARRAADERDDIDQRVHYAFFPGGYDENDVALPGDWAIGPGL